MAVNSVGSAWKTDLRTGSVGRENRLYMDPRGLEYPDLGTGSAQYTVAREDNLIDRGNCELGIAPMIFGETVPLLSNSTFVRSTDFAHTGDSSYKFTKTSAAGTGAYVDIVDNNTTTDMHGLVAGSAIEFGEWMYVPTASGIQGTEITASLLWRLAGGAFVSGAATGGVNTLDAWQKISISTTVPATATGIVWRFRIASTAADTEYFYIDDIKIITHNVPGSHYLSGGYIENLVTLPDKFTLQIKFLPKFAFDTGGNQGVWEWYVSATQYLRIFYAAGGYDFRVSWTDGGIDRFLDSAQYDDGSAARNVSQYITLTCAIDLTTGDTTGSSLWLDKTQDDTAWSSNIDAKTTVFNKALMRRAESLTSTGDYDIAYALMIPDVVATDAQVQNDFKDIKDEQIMWSLDGHGTGRTRANITSFMVSNDSYKGVSSKVSASQGTNLFNFRLNNLNGEFSDDQYASYDASASQYNGTVAQKYLQRRFGIMYETWYGGDFDTLFTGRVTESGLVRDSANLNFGTVSANAEDGIGDIDRSVERYGRVYEDLMLVRSDTVLDRGSCESSTPPAMFGEITNTLSNATFARDDTATQVYLGRYSYKGTKTIAAGTAATITLADSVGAGDLHGFVAAGVYTWTCKLWLPSGAMLGSEWILAIVDSVGSTTQAATNVYDQWQQVTVSRTINAGATYAYPQIQIAAAAAINEVFYFDDTEIEPTTTTEATSRSLLHQIASRSDRKQVQYLSNNSFENATIGNSWLVTAGGAFTKDAVVAGLFGASNGKLVPGAAEEYAYQAVVFTGTKKLNVGETYNFSAYLKSAGAATGANNKIVILELFGTVNNNNSSQTYTLAGGEGYKKVEVSHTITNATSNVLWVLVYADAGDTIYCDGAMLIQADRALEYFEENTLDGTAGASLADLGDEISWPWFGINAGNADYIHGWRRQDIGTTDWTNVKSIANALASRYMGMDEAGTLTLKAVLDKDYTAPVIVSALTASDFRQNITTTLDELMGNKFVGYGTKIEKGAYDRLMWLASGTGNFTGAEGDQQLSEVVADDAFWPNPDDYPEYWAAYGSAGTGTTGTGTTISVITYAPINYTLFLPIGSGIARDVSYTPPDRYVSTPTPFDAGTWQAIKASKSDNIVGIKDADLIGKLVNTGDGNWNMTEVTSGKLLNGLDVTSRAGQARILVFNDLASASVTVMDAGIIGKPVFKFTGAEGYINDGFVDYDSIAKDGERLIEFGGEDVVDGSANGQLDRLADFYWKDRKDRKHLYFLELPGTAYDISPADWYRITAGIAGTNELIDSTAEVLSVRINHDWQANANGQTRIVLREVQENWKPDSNYLARFRARGVPVSKPSGGQLITIGSEFYAGDSDYRIPVGDTSAETLINSAIDFQSGAYGGGIIHLTKGTFKIDGPIIPKDNIIIEGEGASTIIEKNGNFNAIIATGFSGSELSKITVRDLTVTRDSGDANTKALVLFQYVDDALFKNVYLLDSKRYGLWCENCDRLVADTVSANDWAFGGFYITNGVGTQFINCTVDNTNITLGAGFNYAGALFSGSDISITNLSVRNISGGTGGYIAGIYVSSPDKADLVNSTIDNITNTTGAGEAYGVETSSSANNILIGNTHIIDVDNSTTAANSFGLSVRGDNCVMYGMEIDSGTGTGVKIQSTANRTTLVNVLVQNNTTKGIVIISGATNSVINNCIANNNGADTGIGNTNGDNFSDAGTGTIIG